MRIFIDTNKYLDFYRASDHSLSRLDTLVDLISKNKVEVIVPEQVYSEFLRDKEIVYQEFVKSNFIEIKIPGFLKGDKAIYRVNKSIEKIKLNYDKKFFSTKSKINQTFKKFFEAAGIVNETPEIVQRAYFRTLKGNPPRKGNRSFGDAIIWETLLEKFSDKELVIVSGDGDWSSEINKSVINPFLLYVSG